MITDHNIVCIASSWFDHPTSKHHVMRRLAATNHVLWVNFHASRRPQLTRADTNLIVRRLKRVFEGAQRVADHIDVLSPLLLPFPESRAARWFNARALQWQIRTALRTLRERPLQLWLFTPDVPELIPLLRPQRVVYYCVDDFAAFAGFNTKLVERLEQRTMARSDAVITTSEELHAPRAAAHHCVHLVPHGVDVSHFARAVDDPDLPVPDELQAIPRPIFGYMGMLSDWVDQELLADAARRRPDWSFVLLGDSRCDTSTLTGLPNLHMLGGRPYAELPAYCRGFDVGLIPFRMSRLIRAVNPIKLREYLAAGLPVVSAPMDAVRPYAPAVQLAETTDQFIAACTAALQQAESTPAAERQQLVAHESWEQRMSDLSHVVQTLPSTSAAQPARATASQVSPEPAAAVH
jgi:glycosyltransferase involved in cell wall biosynthesis